MEVVNKSIKRRRRSKGTCSCGNLDPKPMPTQTPSNSRIMKNRIYRVFALSCGERWEAVIPEPSRNCLRAKLRPTLQHGMPHLIVHGQDISEAQARAEASAAFLVPSREDCAIRLQSIVKNSLPTGQTNPYCLGCEPSHRQVAVQ